MVLIKTTGVRKDYFTLLKFYRCRICVYVQLLGKFYEEALRRVLDDKDAEYGEDDLVDATDIT